MIRLHHCHQTRSMRTLWLLNELDVEFDVIIYPFDKTLRSKEFLAINPAGRVPALELDDEIIWESGAITQVLCERFSSAGLGRDPNDAERVEWLIWLHFSETITQHCATLTQQHIVLYDDAMRSPIVMRLEAKRLGKCYAALDGRLSARADLLDGGFSAADISVGQAIYMARHFARIDGFAALANWYDRICARPAFIASLPPPDASLLYEKEFYEPWDG
ncbi:MAG: glutathione S-transferase family protein [Paracoccaceae bacterium]